jgi:uncharacterized membrane protein
VREPKTDRDVGRFNAFTDGVMVVSMTLLILNVQLPDTVKNLDGLGLLRALGDVWPNYVGYVLSFLVIAQYWMGYTDYFGDLRKVDNGFVWLTILLLLVVGFVPFVTAMLSRNGGWLSTALYALAMMLISTLLIAMSFYARRKGLIEAQFPDDPWWREVAPWLQIVFVFALSIAVALWNPQLAKFVWLLLAVPVTRYLPNRSAQREAADVAR